MRLIQVIRELLGSLDPAQIQAFIALLKLIFGGNVGPAFATGPNDPHEKEQLKTDLVAKGCSPTDAEAIVEGVEKKATLG